MRVFFFLKTRTCQQTQRTKQFVLTWLSFPGGIDDTVSWDALENDEKHEIHPHTYTVQDASGVRCGEWSASVRARVRACVFVSARQTERKSRARERSAKPVRTVREEKRAPLWKPVPKILLLYENGPFTGRTRSWRIYYTWIFFSVHAQGVCEEEKSGFESGAAELRRILSCFTSEEKIVSADAKDKRKYYNDTNQWGTE